MSGDSPLCVDDVFGDGGVISRRLPHYESRPEQMEMAQAVAESIARQEHLLVEAGTGVGKSFGYLVPAILKAVSRDRTDGKKRKIVISTHTISLQEQLVHKDLPFLNAILPVEFSFVLVKGRSNYVSLRRLNGAFEKSRSLFGEDEEVRQIRALKSWGATTTDGSLADLDFKPLPTVWDEVRSEHGNCLGKSCPTHQDCLYYKARRRVWNADLLIVNHALFFSDLALRREGASVLPDYDVVIFDEAHTIEDVASSHLGMAVSSGQFSYLFNKLYNDRSQKGLLLMHSLGEAQRLVLRLRYLVDDLFSALEEQREENCPKNGRVRRPLNVQNPVSSELHDLALMIRDYATKVKADEQKIELTAAADRVDGLGLSLTSWLNQKLSDSVYWIETTGGRQRSVKLMSSPIEVGPVLQKELFGEIPSVILTSATLSIGRRDFRYLRNRLGMETGRELKLGSPFDYREQALLVLPQNMPDPSDNPAQFETAVCERIKEQVLATQGRAFVLFTSYGMLRNCATRLQDWFAEHEMLLLCQGEGQNRSLMLDRFRQHERPVLFGTDSFWQGVDVPGDQLQNVIITRLPFSVPDHPLLEARVERIRENGGNPFFDFQVPEAAIKLRQGFGRLIRSRTDTGRVVILDPRIRTKQYGKLFLESLPECRREFA